MPLFYRLGYSIFSWVQVVCCFVCWWVTDPSLLSWKDLQLAVLVFPGSFETVDHWRLHQSAGRERASGNRSIPLRLPPAGAQWRVRFCRETIQSQKFDRESRDYREQIPIASAPRPGILAIGKNRDGECSYSG